MFAIIGIVIVIGSVLGGYLLSHGNIMVLVQPYEFRAEEAAHRGGRV